MRAADRGSATLFAVAALGLLLTVGSALGVVGALLVAHRAAQAAADLAALAGATALQQHVDPCAASTRLAAANGASLTSCHVSGEVVEVTVEVAGPHWLGQRGDLVAVARGGPSP